MTRRLVTLCAALALFTTLGCGNKGPLTLPADLPAGEQPPVEKETEK